MEIFQSLTQKGHRLRKHNNALQLKKNNILKFKQTLKIEFFSVNLKQRLEIC